MILEFALRMTLLTAYPPASSLPKDTIETFSEESGYLIKYQKCLHADLLETRYFLPHPTEQKFIEIEKNLMEKERNQWRDSMRFLKLLCDVHQGPVYTCHVVQRDRSATDPITRGRPAVEKMDLKDILFEWRLQ